jgi:hypothetical protein
MVNFLLTVDDSEYEGQGVDDTDNLVDCSEYVQVQMNFPN